MQRDIEGNDEPRSQNRTASVVPKYTDNASGDDSCVSLVCDRPGCEARKPFLNRSELR